MQRLLFGKSICSYQQAIMRLFVTVACCFVSVAATKCPSGWAHSGMNLCLKPMEFLKQVSFHHASKSCGSQNATVVYPRTPEEVKALSDFAQSQVRKLKSSTESIWLNIDDDLSEGSYQSQGQDALYLEWDVGEPKNNENKNCVVLDLESEKFMMADCSSKTAFICQMPKFACIDGYEPIGDKCLKFITNNRHGGTFAGTSCRNAGGGWWPAIRNQRDLQIYDEFWNSRRNKAVPTTGYYLAMGYYSSRWRTFSDGRVAPYLPWAPSEPGRAIEQCLLGLNGKSTIPMTK